MPPKEDNSHYEKILATGEVKCIDDEIPFEIPENWAWCRISHLFAHTSGKQQSSNNTNGTPQKFITTSNLYWGHFVLNNIKVMNFTEEEIRTCSATKGDLLVCEGGAGYGRSAIWDKDYDICLQNHVHRLRPYILGLCEYVYHFIYLLKESNRLIAVGTAMPGLSANRLKSLLLPFPPFDEQQRIVKKIEELSLIVEHYNLAQTQLNTLNSEINNLLKKSILQEAIQGRLVPQIDSEESATVLLEKIKEEKSRLVKEGKLKKKDLTDSTIFKGDDNKYYEKCGIKVTYIDNEIPFTIPESWQWARLGELITTKTGLAYSKPNLEIKSNKMVRVLRGGNITNGSWQMKADDVMISSEFVKPELYLRKGYFITPAVTSWENMGKTALVRECYEDVVVGGFVLMMCPFYIDGIFEEYLNHFFQSTLFQQYCRSITNKSGQAFYNLSRNKLLQLLVPIPPVKEQQRIYHKLNDALASIMSR